MATGSENPWKTFFDQHAVKYMQEVFTRHTQAEIEFLVHELDLPKGSHILDVGCGTGRHAVGLALCGYRVTGVDLSAGMLAEARLAADRAGVDPEWIQADATNIQLDSRVDAAICLCEGAFGLLGSLGEASSHEGAILNSIHGALKSDGKLILNAPNGLAKIRAATPEQVAEGIFDPLTIIETFEVEVENPGESSNLTVYERGFVPSELRMMLEITGFEVEGIFGGTAGAWNRSMVSLDEIEIMAIARKR